MKTLTYRLLIPIFSILLFISCSNEGVEEVEENSEEETPIEIRLALEFENAFQFVGTDSKSYVKNQNGIDITHKVQFELNGEPWGDRVLRFQESGTNQVTVIYEETSHNFSVEVFENSYTTKVLVEDYTGAWCGFCPRVAFKLDAFKENNEHLILSAIHNGDQMEYSFESFLRDRYDVSGFPTAKISRTLTWDERDSALEGEFEKIPGLGLAIRPSLEGSTMNLDVEVGIDIPLRDLKLVVYLQENGLIYPQRNYYNEVSTSPGYGLGEWIETFEHNHVVRAALTDVFGDEIPNTGLSMESNYSQSFEFDLQTYDISLNRLHRYEWVAFVMDKDDRVINVQTSAFDQVQDFD